MLAVLGQGAQLLIFAAKSSVELSDQIVLVLKLLSQSLDIDDVLRAFVVCGIGSLDPD